MTDPTEAVARAICAALDRDWSMTHRDDAHWTETRGMIGATYCDFAASWSRLTRFGDSFGCPLKGELKMSRVSLRVSGETTVESLTRHPQFLSTEWVFAAGECMQDTLYRASIEGPRRRLLRLPFGLDVGSSSMLHYHFYALGDEGDPHFRAQRAVQKIRKAAKWANDINPKDKDEIGDIVLLGMARHDDIRKTIQEGRADEVITETINRGELNAQFRAILEERTLPFRQSPLEGLNLSEIAKNPNTLAVLAVAIAGSKAPIAIVVLPFGVVAMHVAMRSGPRIADWVDKKLEEWLR